MQRAPSRVQDYRIMVERHFEPFFGGKASTPAWPTT